MEKYKTLTTWPQSAKPTHTDLFHMYPGWWPTVAIPFWPCSSDVLQVEALVSRHLWAPKKSTTALLNCDYFKSNSRA